GWPAPRRCGWGVPTRPSPEPTRSRQRRAASRLQRSAEERIGSLACDIQRTFGRVPSYTPRPGRIRTLVLVQDRIRLDVDLRARGLRGESGVLALLADRERQLVVGDQSAHGLGLLVEDEARRHLRGRKRVGDEGREVGVEVDDVDLLRAQLVLHGADAAAHLSDAGTL